MKVMKTKMSLREIKASSSHNESHHPKARSGGIQLLAQSNQPKFNNRQSNKIQVRYFLHYMAAILHSHKEKKRDSLCGHLIVQFGVYPGHGKPISGVLHGCKNVVGTGTTLSCQLAERTERTVS